MISRTGFLLTAILMTTAVLTTGRCAVSAADGLELRVMSFNIRNGRANDGENAWKKRSDFVGDVIRDAHADVIGLQEAFRFQLDELGKQLPEFAEIGEGRDGEKLGEYSAILYRRDRFRVADSGTFWLSDTPGVKSRHWGNRYLRICTWARLQEISTGHGCYVFNTHFDHQSQNARLKSSALIMSRISQREHSDPVVLTCDFNADEDNPVIRMLKGTEPSETLKSADFVDTFRVLHPDAEQVGTGGGFEGRVDGKKIDYIFVQPKSRVTAAEIIRTQRQGRFPSDHFPVTATVILPVTGLESSGSADEIRN